MKDANLPLPGEIVELGEPASLAELERVHRYIKGSVFAAVETTELYPSPHPLPQGEREAWSASLELRQADATLRIRPFHGRLAPLCGT